MAITDGRLLAMAVQPICRTTSAYASHYDKKKIQTYPQITALYYSSTRSVFYNAQTVAYLGFHKGGLQPTRPSPSLPIPLSPSLSFLPSLAPYPPPIPGPLPGLSKRGGRQVERPCPPFPFPPLPLEVGPLNTAKGSGGAL